MPGEVSEDVLIAGLAIVVVDTSGRGNAMDAAHGVNRLVL